MELRDYQKEAVEEVRTALAKYRRVLFQLNTGAGKSLCFSYMALASQKYGRRVLILSHRSEILAQNGGTLERMGLSVQYVDPKMRSVPDASCVCAMSQTLRRRLEKPEWREWVRGVDFCIVDEAHCCDHDFIYDYLSDSCFRLLVTATPCRQGHQRQLGEFARAMVIGVGTKELIRRGYLCPARHFSVAAPKLDDVAIDSGTKEYNQKSLAVKFEDRTLYSGVIDEWLRLCKSKKTLVFCVSARQAIDYTKELVERGISARYALSGAFSDDAVYSGARSEVFEAFKRGDFQVLVNVGIAVAGTDIPDVECIVANFATTSLSKWRQVLGRGCRIAPGKKEFFILDAGDNIRRLGFFETDVQWSLWHDESSGGGLQVLKDCPTDKMDVNHKFGCGARVPSSCRICPSCGYKFHTEKDLVQLHLEEVSESDDKKWSTWAAGKKLEGWSLNRILVQCCLANLGKEKEAFIDVYSTLYPGKGIAGANRYWYVFKKNVWDKIKHRRNDNRNGTA